jgi:putative DNA methylase
VSDRRLIEVAFPLKQASIDSVHEKNVRHGHISTLHIWPARRPLAASRAALIATLLPDPGTPEARKELVERLGGHVVKVLKKKQGPGGGEDKVVEETVGGILHWGRETSNKAGLDLLREEIRKAYGGRAPRILDPFAGGGAIPLEAMRLGCEVTAIDINPVAWFILKCTLEYPQKVAGQKQPLPEFVRTDRDFMEAFFKAQGMKGAMLRTQLKKLGLEEVKPNTSGAQQPSLQLEIEGHTLDADFAWHVRAWGWWVFREARKRLSRYYPVYAEWQPLKDVEEWRKRLNHTTPMQVVPLSADGVPDVDALNRELSPEYLADEHQPRWVAKPTVAYLWARTVACKHCRATIPLLKTRWLGKKDSKRVLLMMESTEDRTGVTFSVQSNIPSSGGNNAQRREHDRIVGQGTMSRSGAWCPCCGRPGTVAMESGDLRAEAVAGRMGTVLTAVVVDGPSGKEYRVPSDREIAAAAEAINAISETFAGVPFGTPDDPVPQGGSRTGGGSPFTVHLYGLRTWSSLFTGRQLLAMGTLAGCVRANLSTSSPSGRALWSEPIAAYLAVAIDKQADRLSSLCRWDQGYSKVSNTFARFALPIMWDFAETNPLGNTTGNWRSCVEWVAEVIEDNGIATFAAPEPHIIRQSALEPLTGTFDAIVTDPPYYDAIPYSDLMDFFYVWLRRTTRGLNDTIDRAFELPLGPKWDAERSDGELIDDASRHSGDSARSKAVYEDGMARVFTACRNHLTAEGVLVIVFANKQPAAWETLVGAMIRAGFTVDGSWPIQTEMGNRQRALAASALASSVWLVCRKRPTDARAGWDNLVLQEMRLNIAQQLREFWDAGIHGPDFVWAATGPALEAFSKHPVVKKANAPGETMGVGEFLTAVRRIVVEFVVGRVLSESAHAPADATGGVAASLDDVTTYYLLHRHDFGMNDAPAGACILYAMSCKLSESELADRYDLLLRTGGVDTDDDGEVDLGDADADGEATEGSGSTFKLKPWKQRRRPTLGIDPIAEQARQRQKEFEALGDPLFDDIAPTKSGTVLRVIPLIDSIHRLMHLWVEGDVVKVNEYLDDRGLRRSETFRQVLQALIELAGKASEERAVLESLSNHVRALGERTDSLLDKVRG